jgi:hypothetical protein
MASYHSKTRPLPSLKIETKDMLSRVITPQWSDEVYYSQLDIYLSFDQSSGGVIAINECRRKYAAKFRIPFRPFRGKHLLSRVPLKYFEFRQEALKEYTAKHSTFIMKLGSPNLFFRPRDKQLPSLRWYISKFEKLAEFNIHMQTRFASIMEEMRVRIEIGGPVLG